MGTPAENLIDTFDGLPDPEKRERTLSRICLNKMFRASE